jgi:hypothetical protein
MSVENLTLNVVVALAYKVQRRMALDPQLGLQVSSQNNVNSLLFKAMK